MLHRVSIKGFKSLVDIDLVLPPITVLAGPNAAGKSNMLDAIQMLARAGTQRTLADALTPPIRGFPTEAFTLPQGGLPELLKQQSASFVIQADLVLERASISSRADRIRYRMGVDIDPDTGALSMSDEYFGRLSKAWDPKDLPRIEVVDEELHLRRSGGGGRPAHEQLGANHTLLSDARLSGSSYPLFDRTRDELRNWRTYYLDPAVAMRAAVPPREVTDIGPSGEHLAPFLYGLKVRDPQVFAAIGRSLRSVIPAVGKVDVDLDAKRGTLDIQIEQDGTVFSSRIISEGTLRVLGLCAIAVTATSGLVAFEEPENGVQPQRLDRIAELLASIPRRGGSQLVVTTHSPGFIAAMLDRARDDEGMIGLFSVARNGRSTVVSRLEHLGLWQEPAIQELLHEPDSHDAAAALIRRGWLDI
jgi:predicted ATPase